MDRVLALYFQDTLLEGGAPSIGSKLLAATLHTWPFLGAKIALAFPCAYRCLLGWQKMVPAVTRPPLPYLAVISIVIRLLSWNEIAMAICVYIGMKGYIRPRELTSLLRSQLIAPQVYCGSHFKFLAINLHPRSQNRMSKTGYWDESILMDTASDTAWLHPFFEALVEGDNSLPLWPFSHTEFVCRFRQAVNSLGLMKLQCCLYSLRHSGASQDWLTQVRSLPKLKARGRWTSGASLRRYQKAAQAQQQLALMPDSVREAASPGARCLSELFHQPRKAQLLNRSMPSF